jgi:hypothetical protein
VEVRNQLAATVIDDPPALSHYWGIDIDAASRAGYLAVGVCPGFRWECFSAANRIENVKAYDALSVAAVNTPVCIPLSRRPPLCPKKP